MQYTGRVKEHPRECSSSPLFCSRALNSEETLRVLATNISEEDIFSSKRGQDIQVPVINMQIKSMSDDIISEQVETPAGLEWIKNHYNFKMEVGQFLQLLKWLVSLPRGS